MARDLKLQTNVDGVSGDYPSGRMRDDSGSGDGTPVSEALNGDMMQFFAKLMRDAGITPNNSPDNTANTFQLSLALSEVIKRDVKTGWTNTDVILDGAMTEIETVEYRILGDVGSGTYKVEWRGMVEYNGAGSQPVILTSYPATLTPGAGKTKEVPIGISAGGDRSGVLDFSSFSAALVVRDWTNPITQVFFHFDSVSYWIRP